MGPLGTEDTEQDVHNTPEGHHGRSHTCQVWADHPTFQKLPQPSPEESRWEEAPGNVRLLSSVHETASSRATSFWSPACRGPNPTLLSSGGRAPGAWSPHGPRGGGVSWGPWFNSVLGRSPIPASTCLCFSLVYRFYGEGTFKCVEKQQKVEKGPHVPLPPAVS